jgi:CRISPR/Cas system CSM-associated protein Csm3 (group 7 of RAMP superfamily)
MPYALDVFVNRYQLCGELEAVTALHVGGEEGGAALDPRRPDSASVRWGASDAPFLPGSSLKGASRAWLTRVLRAKYPTRPCGNPCDGRAGVEALCPVCRLFGTPGFAGRLLFADAPAVHWEGHGRWERRSHVALDLDTGSRRTNLLFTIEVVPAGTRFRVEWYADNVDDEDRDHLRMLRAAFEEGWITLGGGASRGLGRVRLVGARENEETLESLARRIGRPAAVPRAALLERLQAAEGETVTFDQLAAAYDQAAAGTG